MRRKKSTFLEKNGIALMGFGILLIIGAVGGYETGGDALECLKYCAWGTVLAIEGYLLIRKEEKRIWKKKCWRRRSKAWSSRKMI